MPCPAQAEMKMRCGFALIMKNIIEKTEAVMEIGTFTIGDFSKGISDFCDRLYSDKELFGIFAVIVREDICVCDICFGIKSRRRSIKTENTAGCRNRSFRYTVISRILRKAPVLRYHSSYDLGCRSLPEGSLWIH